MSDLQEIIAKDSEAIKPSKPLKGKYDGRGKYDRTHLKLRPESKPGPKPKYLQQISQRSAVKVMAAFDLIASLADIYKAAWDDKQYFLCVQMQDTASNRAFGKPFTALNPDATAVPATYNDNRLQVAIGSLLPAKPTAPVPAKLLVDKKTEEKSG